MLGREMPIGRYIAWVGTCLVALLFLGNWLVPPAEPEPVIHLMQKPVIRITSVEQLPERIDIDTSQPTIVPPQSLTGEPQAQPPIMVSYASTASPPLIFEVDKKRQKVAKRKRPKVAPKHLSLPSTVLITSDRRRTVPLTKVSFLDIVSGRLVKSMLNLR